MLTQKGDEMEIIRVDFNGIEAFVCYCLDFPTGKELEALADELCRLNTAHKKFLAENNYHETGYIVMPSVLFSLNVNGKRVINDVILEVYEWVNNVLDKSMPSNMGAEITVPAFFNLRNIDNNEPMFVFPISPVERVIKPQRGVCISDSLLKRVAQQ